MIVYESHLSQAEVTSAESLTARPFFRGGKVSPIFRRTMVSPPLVEGTYINGINGIKMDD